MSDPGTGTAPIDTSSSGSSPSAPAPTALTQADLEAAVGPLREGLSQLIDRVRDLEAAPDPASGMAELRRQGDGHNAVLRWLLGPDGWLRQYYRGHFEVPAPAEGQPSIPPTPAPQVATLVPPETPVAAPMPPLP